MHLIANSEAVSLLNSLTGRIVDAMRSGPACEEQRQTQLQDKISHLVIYTCNVYDADTE
jgi:hypothetical protein